MITFREISGETSYEEYIKNAIDSHAYAPFSWVTRDAIISALDQYVRKEVIKIVSPYDGTLTFNNQIIISHEHAARSIDWDYIKIKEEINGIDTTRFINTFLRSR